ncbi:hypothetical protein FLAV_01752 [Flavobacteriales bacterium]|nr:hypothetical protein [Flavobacteriales bacterium]MCL4816957.1 hypothetical protein [Flavobacteriales bacterium]WKZ76017.1 MAG: DUF6265 family protein [Vicingaceae bacterium]CAG0980703.1 hypothetical protein FLAV_01752 [Flavobacteriales bacterium]
MKNLFVLFVAFSFICSCAETDEMQFVKKLGGKWASEENENSRFFEEWEVLTNGNLRGKGFLLSDGVDTTVSEELKIEKIKNEIFYVATVKNENNNQPVKFLLVENDSQHLVFENKLHDFPQRIKYFFLSERELKVVVEGEYKGQNESNEMLLGKW